MLFRSVSQSRYGSKVGVIRVTSSKFSNLTKDKEYDVYESSVGIYHTHYDNGNLTPFLFEYGNILKENIAEWVDKPSNSPLEPVAVFRVILGGKFKAVLDGKKLEFYTHLQAVGNLLITIKTSVFRLL